jgi:hypothetical protein
MRKGVIINKAAVTIHGLKPGAEKSIPLDDVGTPVDRHWRRRLNDSRIDGAIVFKEGTEINGD